MAVKNGDDILISVAGTTIGATISADKSLTKDMIDVTTKDSNKNKEYIAGEGDGTATFEGKYDPNTSGYSYSQLFSAYDNGTEVAVIFGLNQVGDTAYSFQALVSDLSIAGPKNEASTFNGTLQKTGDITEITVT